MRKAVLVNLLWVAIFAYPWWGRAENFVSTDYLAVTSSMYRPEVTPSNEDLLDNPLIYLPGQVYLHDSLRQGRLPFWDPYFYAGSPIFSDGQSGYFYLPRLLLLKLLPLDVAWNLSLFGHLFLASLAAFALARERGFGHNAALLFSTCWMFNGPCLTWLEMDYSAIFILWVPVCLWVVPRAGRDWRWVPLAALAVDFLLTAGHLQWVLYSCLLVFGDALWRLRKAPWEQWLRTGATGFLGLLLAAPLLLPTAVHMAASQRVDNPGDFLQSSFRQFLETAPLTLSFPDWWGSPANGFEFRRVFGYGNFIYPELCVFCGNVVLALALLGLLSSSRARKGFFLVGVLLLIATTPLYPWLAKTIPGLVKLVPTRLTWVLCLGLISLAAVGFEAWDGGRATFRQRRAVALACLGLIAVGFAWVSWMQTHPAIDPWIAGGQLRLPDPERYVSGDGYRAAVAAGFHNTYRLLGVSFLPHFLTLGTVAFLLLQSGAWARQMVLVVAGAELLAFAAHFNPSLPGPIFPDNALARKIAAQAAGDRCMGLMTIKPNQMAPFGVNLVEGYDSFYPRPTALVAAHLAGFSPQAPPLASNPGLSARLARSPWLDLLNVGYILGISAAPPADQWEVVADLANPLTLFHNPRRLDRVRVVGQAVVEPDLPKAVQRIESGQTDPRQTALVMSEVGPLGGSGEAVVASYEPEQVTIQADISGRALVVLADSFSPGWTVSVDGQERPLLQCDVMLRGVAVEQGQHRILFRYRPPGFDLGCGLAVGALLALVAIGLVSGSRRPRSSVEPAD